MLNQLSGSIVFPGAGYIAMMIASSAATQNILLEEITFKSALVFSDKETPKKTQVVLNSSPAKSPTSVSVSLSPFPSLFYATLALPFHSLLPISTFFAFPSLTPLPPAVLPVSLQLLSRALFFLFFLPRFILGNEI